MSFAITAACTGCGACIRICPVGAISGERKQLHLIDSAACIDCGACGRICPFRAVLDDRDVLYQMLKRSQWLLPLFIEERCISCGVCLDACPAGVLDFAALTDHQVRPVAYLRDAQGCIGCSFCAAACPVDAVLMQAAETR